MKKPIILISILVSLVFVIQSCKKSTRRTDKDLYKELSEPGYTFYKGGAILPAKGSSPHGPFKVRFNSTAYAALDTAIKLPVGNSFPNGSIIVKELYDGTTLTLYVVMKKQDDNKNAADGWLWSEYELDGSVLYSVGSKGNSCTDCHKASNNRDLTLLFDLH